MLTLDEARALLASQLQPLTPHTLPLRTARGRRLASAVRARLNLPPADVSAMDGYAARAAELAASAVQPVAFVVAAGELPRPLPGGAAARIFTGAVLPAGADCVVIQEDATVLEDGQVRLRPVPAGENVRRRAEVFAEGEILADAGDALTPARLALLAAAGVDEVEVVPRPRVALLVTGSELANPGELPSAAQIRDSNGPLLAALAEEADVPLALERRCGDDEAALRSHLRELAAAAEVVVTTGGVSVGEPDLVPAAVARLGGRTVFHKVAIQPGKPVLVAHLDGTWLIGLPGNPVSVLVGWRMFVLPLLAALAGDDQAFAEQPRRAVAAAGVRNRGLRTLLRPALLRHGEGTLSVRVLDWKGSHDLKAAAPANALVRLNPHQQVAAGEVVLYYPLAGWL